MGRCAKRLLVPYAICGVVVVPTVNFLLTGRLAESFFGGWRNAFLLNRFLWYLPCCFLLTCIFCVVALSARGTRGIRWHVGVAAALAAVVSARWLFPGVDYFRSVVNYFVPFFAGAWLWSWHDRVLHPGRFLTVCSSLAFAAFAVLYASWPGMPLVAKGVVKPLAGVASLFPLMAIANTLKGFVSSAVAHIGRITLFIYCFDFCATPIMTWHFHPGGVISSLAVAFGVVALGVFFNLAWEYAVLPEIKRHLV